MSATTLPHNGTSTSIAAAESMVTHAESIKERVYNLILSQGFRGCTSAEIEHVTGIDGNTIRPRIVTLRDVETRICDSGMRRLTASGRKAVVWIAVGAT